jgi:GT2 family glycosyltransferase
LVLFTDQDCLVPPDWVDQVERHFADATVHAVGGAVDVANPESASGYALYYLEFLNHFPSNGPVERNSNFLVGCNTALRAEVIRTQRFPDRTLGEDILFTHQLRQAGFHVVYDPRLVVRHHNREGWGEFFRYNDSMGRASARYHALLRLWWAVPVLRWPILAFAAPVVVLPSIARALLRSRWSTSARFLLLSPMCLLGNLTWANGFRREANAMAAAVRLPRRCPREDPSVQAPR